MPRSKTPTKKKKAGTPKVSRSKRRAAKATKKSQAKKTVKAAKKPDRPRQDGLETKTKAPTKSDMVKAKRKGLFKKTWDTLISAVMAPVHAARALFGKVHTDWENDQVGHFAMAAKMLILVSYIVAFVLAIEVALFNPLLAFGIALGGPVSLIVLGLIETGPVVLAWWALLFLLCAAASNIGERLAMLFMARTQRVHRRLAIEAEVLATA